MSLAAWLLMGLGVFVIYCAIAGLNPLAVAGNRLALPPETLGRFNPANRTTR